MEKRFFTLVLVVALGVLVGIGIVSKQTREPMLRSLSEQQQQILKVQNRIEQKLSASQSQAAQMPSSVDQSGLSGKVQALEQRLAMLEGQMKGIQTLIQQAKGNAGQQRQAPPPEDLTTVHEIPVEHSAVYGNKKAPVTIVEFADFQCPFCFRFHTPMMEAVKAYPKEVNYILKNFPLSFHQQARPAAKAAFAAGLQGKYWEMAEALLANGKDLSEQKIEELAKGLKLNVKKFLKDYKDKDAQWESYIQKDIQLGSKVGVRGTTSFYINGRKTNARDVASWKREIENILKNKK